MGAFVIAGIYGQTGAQVGDIDILFGATVVLLIVGLVNRRSVLAWFGGRGPARAGFLGALVAIAVGSLANDSGSVLLVIGTIYLAACVGFFWGTRPLAAPPPDH